MEAGTLTLEDVLQDHYIPGTMEVSKTENGTPHITKDGSTGHTCLRDDCSGNLVWGNTMDFVFGSYALYCRTCYSSWRAPKGYLWPLVKEALGSEVAEPETVTPSDKSAFEQAVEVAHKTQDELAQAQATVEQRKQAKANAKKPKVEPQAPGQMSLLTPEAPKSDRTAICIDCKTTFEKPVRRGRPPVKCKQCGGWGT